MNRSESNNDDYGTYGPPAAESHSVTGSKRLAKEMPPHLPQSSRSKTARLIQFVLLTILLSCAELGHTADQAPANSTEPTPTLPSQTGTAQTATAQPSSGKTASASTLVSPKPVFTAPALLPGNTPQPTTAVRAASERSYSDVTNLLLVIALIILVLIFLAKATPVLIEHFTPQLQALGVLPTLSPEAWPKTLAEEKDFTKFIVEFQAGPASPTATPPPSATSPAKEPAAEAGTKPASKDGDPLKEFFRWAPAQMIDMRYLVDRINRTKDKSAKREKLSDLAHQIRSLKNKASLPELLPVWQMSCAMDGLVKQLIDRVDTINPSTLRTISGGIDLLGELCVPELRVDLASNPPIKILAVDDDQVTRFALNASLKKGFNQPDLAENGNLALALVGQNTYDIIFMDVQMPGMDGFEVCSKIHESALNAATPVVFVTSMKDFESHAKSIVSGGSDLIGKPFLTFEIAVKAFTLVLHARLQIRNRAVEGSNETGATEFITAKTQIPASAPVAGGPSLPAPDTAVLQPNAVAEPKPATQPAGSVSTPEQLPAGSVVTGKSDAGGSGTAASPKAKFSPELLTQVAASLTEIRNEIRSVGQTEDGVKRGEKLVTVYLRLQLLTRQIDLPELRPAFLLASALQGLMKKLQHKPANAGASTLDTAATAVDLLKDLCVKGVRADLATTPAISMLVVDDEPLARRAIVGALQTAFLKPDSAESGEAALMLATEKTFDVIFLDVQMPGMDGFTVCKTLHDTVPKFATPVIFVTSHIDAKARVQSAQCGGSDFVVKPFLFTEITVKALTYALRARLQKKEAGGAK